MKKQNAFNLASACRFEVISPLLFVLAVSIICADYFRPDSWSNEIWSSKIKQDKSINNVHSHIDNLFKEQVPSGNVWVEFKNCSSDFAAWVYFRGNYIIYPRRIYASKPMTIVNNGDVLVEGNNLYSRSLADKLGIQWKVQILQDSKGKISLKIERIL